MKILYLITKSEAGGAQTHLADLCQYFHNKGHDVVVMSKSGGWLEDECARIGVKFVANKYFSNRANILNIFKAIKEIKIFVNNFKPDLVHCHSSAAGVLGRLAVKGSVRTIYTAHGWGFNIGMKPWVKYPVLFLEKICAHYTNTYICVAEFVKKLGVKYHLAPENKFIVVYNGVSMPILEIAKTNPVQDKISLNFIGRLAEPKKPELTIEALSLLPEHVKEKIIFNIIGDGPKRKFLEELAFAKKVKVNFTGALPREHALKYLQSDDIYIFISAWEGFPYTIIEAMSVGLPVIASDVGGVKEAVDNHNGLVIKNEVGQIREAILKLVHDHELRKKMGNAGKERAQKEFSLENMLTKIDKIYNQIIIK